MEKRLFLAVGLSLLTVFLFQSLMKPQQGPQEAQVSVNKEVATNELQKPAPSSPAVPAQPTPAAKPEFQEETFKFSSPNFDAEFSNRGGRLTRLHLKAYNYAVPVEYVALPDFENVPFTFSVRSEEQVELSYQGQDFQVTKIYKFEQPWLVETAVQVKNVSEDVKSLSDQIKALTIDLGRLDKATIDSDWTLFEYSVKKENKIVRKGSARNFNEKWNKSEAGAVDWFGFRDRYFATVVDFKDSFQGFSVKSVSGEVLSLSGSVPQNLIQPGETRTFDFTIFAGPQKLEILKAADRGFEKIMVFSDWGWLDAISKAIYWLLGTLHKFIPVWGLCIILISLIVYGLMYPLTLKSMLSMKKMQALQPQITELRKKYEKSPDKLNKEIMEMYRRNQVNPVSGCLPLLFQMPIFVGLYQVLWRSIYFRGEGFLWIQDLSMPDRLFHLPFSLPFLGEYFNILPLLMTAIMFFQQKMTMKSMAGGDPDQAAQQKIMAVFFPIFLGFIFYNFASGLNLYFVVFYLLSLVSQLHINKKAAQAQG